MMERSQKSCPIEAGKYLVSCGWAKERQSNLYVRDEDTISIIGDQMFLNDEEMKWEFTVSLDPKNLSNLKYQLELNSLIGNPRHRQMRITSVSIPSK